MIRLPPAPLPSRISDHWPYVRELADRMSQEKRLTDAELAAEAYRQMTRALAESGMVCSADGADINIAPGDATVFGPIRLETSRLGDIKRFATLPHYDEPTTQKVER